MDYSKYSYDQHGFEIYKDFFSAQDIKEIAEVVNRHLDSDPTKEGKAYPSHMSRSDYDAITEEDMKTIPALQRMAAQIEKSAKMKEVKFYNSFYIEMLGKEAGEKSGFVWHLDLPSFCVLEKGTKAVFAWFMLENTLPDQGTVLDVVPRDTFREYIGQGPVDNLDIVDIVPTEELDKMFKGYDFVKEGKYALRDTMNFRIIKFFDRALEEVSLKPKLKPGDLVICRSDTMHRTGPTTSREGKRIGLTLRFVEEGARYNGCLDNGIPMMFYKVFKTSSLWQRLKNKRKGALVVDANP